MSGSLRLCECVLDEIIHRNGSLNFILLKLFTSLLYGCEIWTFKQRDKRKLKTAEVKFIRSTAGYSLLDCRRNEDI
jgi:hypothetical protein